MYVGALIAAFAVTVASWEHAGRDFGNLPRSHVLWRDSGFSGDVVERQASPLAVRAAQDPTCTHGPTTRSCWNNGYSIATDFDRKWPSTGKTRSYTLTITNTTCNPDGGRTRTCLLVNNQYPGPTITADWGDNLSITVVNKMQDNGTSIHWHGIRQLNSVSQDGTNGITECPLAPGQSQTVNFQATQFGTSWYHSHYSSQYGDGIIGPIVINGPAAANYDVDMGPIMVNDWYYLTAMQAHAIANSNLQNRIPPPQADNILFNGLNKNKNGGGKYMKQTVTPGKKYRLRLINPSVDNSLRVSIDNHPMQIMTADFVPVQPFWVDSIQLAPGQRYDVVVNMNKTVGNYWMRANAEAGCFSFNSGKGLAILSYSGAPDADPTTTTTATSSGCNPPGALVPFVQNVAGNQSYFVEQAKQLPLAVYTPGTPGLNSDQSNIVYWGINLTAMSVNWEKPTLSYVQQKNTTYPAVANVIEIPNPNVWTYWIIAEVQGSPVNIPHPLHLHGHDFYELGSGPGTFDINNDPAKLTYNNPTRRDTTYIPGGGWVVLAFPTDNPGAWLFHCHLAWHVSAGLAAQFLETKEQIRLPGADYTNQCSSWSKYYQGAYWKKDDSGL